MKVAATHFCNAFHEITRPENLSYGVRSMYLIGSEGGCMIERCLVPAISLAIPPLEDDTAPVGSDYSDLAIVKTNCHMDTFNSKYPSGDNQL